MSHAILIKNKTFSTNVDSLNRSVKASYDIDNGNVFLLNAGVGTGTEREVFTCATPNSATPTDLWMACEPEVVITNSQYKGLDPDPRNFYNVAGTVFTAFKPKKFDVITVTADAFTGSRTAQNYCDVASGSNKLAWASSSTAATMFKLLEVTTIALPAGSPGNGRVTAYRLECIQE